MLFGGLGADGKPLNDAWVLDLEQRAWSLIYLGHPDLCPPQVGCCYAFLSSFITVNRQESYGCFAVWHESERTACGKPDIDNELLSLLEATSTLSPTCPLISTCCLQGAVATLHGSKLVCLNSAAGSPKLDLAMSLDIQATAVSMHFTSKTNRQWQLAVVLISWIGRNVNMPALTSVSPLLSWL